MHFDTFSWFCALFLSLETWFWYKLEENKSFDRKIFAWVMGHQIHKNMIFYLPCLCLKSLRSTYVPTFQWKLPLPLEKYAAIFCDSILIHLITVPANDICFKWLLIDRQAISFDRWIKLCNNGWVDDVEIISSKSVHYK